MTDGEEVIAGSDGFITNPLNRDTDGDGFPDGIEAEAGTNPLDATSRPTFPNQPPPGEAVGLVFSTLNALNPSQDSDHDGFSDLVEVSAGTDPSDPASVPNLPRLASEAVGPTFSALNALNPSQDSDNDGFSDMVEVSAGTDPFDPANVPNLPRLASEAVGLPLSILNTSGLSSQALTETSLAGSLRDRDQDGLPDAYEIAYSLDPDNPADAAADADGDGLTNYEEFLLGTHPRHADTDGDGVSDGQEVRAGGNPLLADTTPLTVVVTEPIDGTTWREGQTLTVHVEVSDKVAVASVHITVDGTEFTTVLAAPYTLTFTVPSGVAALTISASVRDAVGHEDHSPVVRVAVTPDPLTTVAGTVVDMTGNPVAGATVRVQLNGLRGDFFAFPTPVTMPRDLTTRPPDASRLVAGLNFRNPQNLFGAAAFGTDLGPYVAARFAGLLRIEHAGRYTFSWGLTTGHGWSSMACQSL